MPEILFSQICAGILIPAFVAGACVVVGQWIESQHKISTGKYGVAFGLAAGFIAGYIATYGWPPFPPRESGQNLVWLAAAAAVCSLLKAKPAWRNSSLAVLTTGLLLNRSLELQWLGARFSWTDNIVEVLLVLTLLFSFAWTVEKFAAPMNSPWPLFTFMGLGICLSLTLALSGSAKLGQAAGIFTAAVGALWFVALWRPLSGAEAALPFIATLYPAFLLLGYFYADLPVVCALVLLAAPGIGYLAGRLFVHRVGPIRRTLITLAVGAIAIALAWHLSVPLIY
jgi:hypothetical protein